MAAVVHSSRVPERNAGGRNSYPDRTKRGSLVDHPPRNFTLAIPPRDATAGPLVLISFPPGVRSTVASRTDLPSHSAELLATVQAIVGTLALDAVLLLAEVPYDFASIAESLRTARDDDNDVTLIIAADKPDVQAAVLNDAVDLVTLSNEPQTRQVQLTQSLVDAIADDLLPTGGRIAAIYPGFERDHVDTISVISLSEQLAKLSSRDLQRLNTQVPLDVLRRCVDLSVEIGREGREGKHVGTILCVGDHRAVLERSHEGVHDPFKGYKQKEKMIRSARVRESMKELAQIDGAFVISSDGVVYAAGRILSAAVEDLMLSKGLGARHWAAAAISKATDAIAIAVSESTGTVRVFQDGKVVLRIEPMDQAMKWSTAEAAPPDA